MNGQLNNCRWDVHHLDDDLKRKLLSDFKGVRDGFIQVGPKKYFLTKGFAEDDMKYATFKPRSTDVWIVTFPRSGTTWTQEMVWLVCNNLDYKKAADVSLLERFPFLEFSSCVSKSILDEFLEEAESDDVKENLKKACGPIFKELDDTTERRFIKSHLPFSLLPHDLLTCGAKVIYVARNPKDVCVSFYNFHKFIKTLDYVSDFKTFWNYFQQGNILWTPYWSHLAEAWELRKNKNLLFVFYEDMKSNLHESIKKVCNFLQKEYREDEIKKLVKHLDFDNFRNNKSVNMEVLRDWGMLLSNDQKCVRKGTPGSWKNFFDVELNEQANEWIQENLKNTDMRFPECE
ncbi:hypothetical protein RUM44_008300 [Polyplax serrata]|uniref:Sulfotransferase domain-containing protein n=1 Tax=Polyplax serrata TaxID=468196 RepID=A0ABR1B7Z3_POLSC